MNSMKLSPKLKISLILLLLITFLAIINLTSFSKEIKNFFYIISSPIQKKLWEVGDSTSDFFEAVKETKNLKRENEELNLRIQELLAENISLKELTKENEILRKALDIGLEENFKLVLAEMIGKDISQDLILINKGSKDGISENLPVITEQKVLVGKISEIYKNFSKVMLLTNKESSLNAKIQNSESIEGVIEGRGNSKLLLKLIPLDKKILKGDLVITTSLGGVFPDGLLVGEIEEVKKSDVESFQKAEVKPVFDIKQTKELFIITNYLQ